MSSRMHSLDSSQLKVLDADQASSVVIQRNTYNSTPVLELITNGRYLMRKIDDGYINATHILSLAGLTKGQRTKTLESFVQTHKLYVKVQGGFSGYQGTWVPSDSAKVLAEMYGVSEHVNALISANVLDVIDIQSKRSVKLKRKKASRHLKLDIRSDDTHQDHIASAAEAQHYQMQTRKRVQRAIPLQSFIRSSPLSTPELDSEQDFDSSFDMHAILQPKDLATRQSLILRNIYTNESNAELYALLHTDTTFDVDMPVDSLGNTALHWSASLSNLQKTYSLLSFHASPLHQNIHGHSAIIRIIQSTSSFYAKSFAELLDALPDAVYIVDSNGQTVWHHLVRGFGELKCLAASKYYLGMMCRWVGRREVKQWDTMFLNIEDEQGDTAFNLARRQEHNEVAEILALQGAYRS